MAVRSYKLGPGTLTFGASGSLMDATTQVTKAAINPTVDSEDSVTTLSGDTLGGARTYGAELDVTVIQDLESTGFALWTWAHKGEDVPFTYTPSTAVGVSFSGTVTVDPITIGGDVNGKPTSDFTWSCVGFPTPADDLA